MIISGKMEREIEIERILMETTIKLDRLIQKYVNTIEDREKELNDLYDALEKKEDHIRNLEDMVNDLKDEIYRMENAYVAYPAWTRR